MSTKRWAVEHLPEPVLKILHPFYNQITRTRTWVRKMADTLKLIGPESIYSKNYYAKRQSDPWRSDAQKTAKTLDKYFSPESVIDFGCAIGAHLEPFYDRGVTVKGVEGNPEAFDYAVVPESILVQHDLREPYEPQQDYDLVLCFEVAEHLPEKFADVLVNTLVKSGESVVLTAATPGQGGDHHINEQPRKYWINKFEAQEMVYDEKAVEDLRSLIEPKQTTWITQNIMVFRK